MVLSFKLKYPLYIDHRSKSLQMRQHNTRILRHDPQSIANEPAQRPKLVAACGEYG